MVFVGTMLGTTGTGGRKNLHTNIYANEYTFEVQDGIMNAWIDI